MARNDLRLSFDFPTHRKTRRLILRLGDAGPMALIRLWVYTAHQRRDGILRGLTNEDIALEADWRGDPEEFVRALVDIHFLDETEEGLVVHDWEEHQPWIANSDERSEKARKSANLRHHGDPKGKAKPDSGNVRSATETDADRMRIAGGDDKSASGIHAPTVRTYDHDDDTPARARVRRVIHTLEEHVFILDGHQVAEVTGELEHLPAILAEHPDTWCDWVCQAIKVSADQGKRTKAYLMAVIRGSRERQEPPGSKPPSKREPTTRRTEQSGPPATRRSPEFERAREAYVRRRVDKEGLSGDFAERAFNKRLREGTHDEDFCRAIRADAAEVARQAADYPEQYRAEQRALLTRVGYPLAALMPELSAASEGETA